MITPTFGGPGGRDDYRNGNAGRVATKDVKRGRKKTVSLAEFNNGY